MTKLQDGTRTIEIELKVWQGSGYSPDWSKDFFEVGNLPYNDETDAYTVEDVQYCIDQANDWAIRTADFAGDDTDEERAVFVSDIA